MATKIVRPPITAAHVVPPIPIIINNNNKIIITKHKPISATHQVPIGFGFRPIFAIKASEQSYGLAEEEQASTVDQVKADIYEAIQGINRGIFGIPSGKKSEIESLVKLLESQNPTPDPTLHLEKVSGCWKLVYSTITILGSKRTKLGLRDFITLGDFFQIIDVDERVDIRYNNSKITPDQLMNVFRKNYGLLLGIFNPDGWLEITYVDATMRIGRDDKGNIFILERSEENP